MVRHGNFAYHAGVFSAEGCRPHGGQLSRLEFNGVGGYETTGRYFGMKDKILSALVFVGFKLWKQTIKNDRRMFVGKSVNSPLVRWLV